MPSKAVLDAFVALVESEKFDAAIERYYAEDASMQENLDQPRRGRDSLVEHERNVMRTFKTIHARHVAPVFASGDHVVIRWQFEFTGPDGNTKQMDELAYQRWQGDRIVEERFYYDPRQVFG